MTDLAIRFRGEQGVIHGGGVEGETMAQTFTERCFEWWCAHQTFNGVLLEDLLREEGPHKAAVILHMGETHGAQSESRDREGAQEE